MFDAVLFDLDGTLADTAPDLGAALNRLRGEEGCGLPPRTLAAGGLQRRARPSRSRIRLLPRASPLRRTRTALSQHITWPAVRGYRSSSTVSQIAGRTGGTRTFRGASSPTNKAASPCPWWRDWVWQRAAGCVVCGDSAARAKPHPDPLLFAASELLNVRPAALHVCR